MPEPTEGKIVLLEQLDTFKDKLNKVILFEGVNKANLPIHLSFSSFAGADSLSSIVRVRIHFTDGSYTELFRENITTELVNNDNNTTSIVFRNLEYKTVVDFTRQTAVLSAATAVDIDSVPISGSDNAVSSNGVFDAIQDVMEVAEGKNNAFVTDTTISPAFNTDANSITIQFFDVNGDTIYPSDVKVGDVVFVVDLSVPDRWVSSIDTVSEPNTMTLSVLETTSVSIIENIEDGTGTNAVQEKMADATVNFAGRNPNAEELDNALTATINTGASGNQAVAFNKNTMALGTASFTNGNKTVAKGEESHAEGYQSVTLGNGSHAEGNETVAYGDSSHSEGYMTQAKGNDSHAEGFDTVSGGANSHAEGSLTVANAENSHTEGYYTVVKDNYLVVSQGTTPEPIPTPTPVPTPTPTELDALNGNGAHAEGHNTFAFGAGSHAEGDSTKAYGRLSHAEGRDTEAGRIIIRKTEDNEDYYTPDQDKQFQHAEGEGTKAIGHASHAEGLGTEANYDYQHVSGKFNDNKSDTLFEVGNGNNENSRSNAFEVQSDGRATIGADPIYAMDVVTKDYADRISNQIYVLSVNDTISDILAEGISAFDINGNSVWDAISNGDYDNYNFANSSFANNNNILTITDSLAYLIIRVRSNSGDVSFLVDNIGNIFYGNKNGQTIYVLENNYPSRWYNGTNPEGDGYLVFCSTNNISITTTTGSESVSDGTDTLNVATRDTAQEISGAKIFKGSNLLKVSATGWTTKWAFNFDGSANLAVNYLTNNDSSTTHYVFGRTTGFYPATSGGKDLGTSSYTWNDIYVSGSIKDNQGNAVTVEQLYYLGRAIQGLAQPVAVNLSDGDTLTDQTTLYMMSQRLPVVINSAMCYFLTEDTNYYVYTSHYFDSSTLDVVPFKIIVNKTTFVVTIGRI